MTTARGKPQDVGRDYALFLDGRSGEAPLLTVYGGKITTYRRLAEAALDRLAHFFPAPAALDRDAARCRAAIFPMTVSTRCSSRPQERWPFLTAANARRLTRAYGTRVENMLKAARRARRSRRCVSAPISPPPRCAI